MAEIEGNAPTARRSAEEEEEEGEEEDSAAAPWAEEEEEEEGRRRKRKRKKPREIPGSPRNPQSRVGHIAARYFSSLVLISLSPAPISR